MHKPMAIGLAAALSAICATAGAQNTTTASATAADASYYNERFGFALKYPSSTFEPSAEGNENGRVFVSHDGAARLLASAGPNEAGQTLADYRRFVLSKAYPDPHRLRACAQDLVRAVGDHGRYHVL